MRNRFYRTVALIMAFSVFTSSVSWSLDAHYCQGKFSGISLLGETSSCHDVNQGSTCLKKKKKCHQKSILTKTTNKKDCCQNKSFFIEADDQQSTTLSQTTFENVNHELFPEVLTSKTVGLQDHDYSRTFFQYRPPPLDRDLQVHLQVFRL